MDDLDNDNAAILNRQPLKQEQFQRDHIFGVHKMKNDVQRLEAQIASAKKQQIDNTAELEGLRMERGRVSLQKNSAAKLTELNKLIAQKGYDAECAPAVITELERQLAEAKQKLATETRDELLNKQKDIAEQAKSLSKALVDRLKVAVEVNQQLHQVYAQYKSLADLTHQDFLGSHIAEPSNGMLDYLFSFLKGELEEGRHCRKEMSPPI